MTSLQRRQARLAYLMLLPALAVVGFVAAYPLVQTVYESLTPDLFSLPSSRFIGSTNFYNLWHDSVFWNSVVVTIKFTVITVVFEFLLGMIIAMVVNSNFKGRGTMRAVMLIPWAIVTVVSAQIWKLMFNDQFGVIPDILWRLHIIGNVNSFSVLASSTWALPATAAVDIWKTTPFVALLLLAGLQLIPTDMYEAARVDGANPLQQFWRITLPLLRPAILVALIFRTLDALRVFDVFYVFFGIRQDVEPMAVYAYQQIIQTGSLGYGAAVSVAIFLIIGFFVAAYVAFFRVEQQAA